MIFGAAVMDTDRIIPTASQNGSPGSQQSGGPAGGQPHFQGLVGAPLPPPMHSQQPSQQQLYIGSMTRKKKKTERLVPPILNTQSLIDGATDTAHNSNANRPPVYENGSARPLFCGGSDGGDGGFRIEDAAPAGIPNSNISVAGHTNHGYSRDNG